MEVSSQDGEEKSPEPKVKDPADYNFYDLDVGDVCSACNTTVKWNFYGGGGIKCDCGRLWCCY